MFEIDKRSSCVKYSRDVGSYGWFEGVFTVPVPGADGIFNDVSFDPIFKLMDSTGDRPELILIF